MKRKIIPTVVEPDKSDLSSSDKDKPKLRPDSGVASAPGSPLLSRSQLLSKYRNTVDVNEDIFKSIVNRHEEKEKEKEDDQLPPSVPRRVRKSTPSENEVVSDRIEIDSDNIETPPATRKVFYGLQQQNRRQGPRRSASRERILTADSFTKMSSDGRVKGQDEEEMGDGQFERFSSARRTRRYKKSQESDKEEQLPSKKEEGIENNQVKPENNSSQLIPEKQIIRPNTQQAHSSPVSAAQELAQPLTEESQKRLRKWQDRLNHRPSPEKEPTVDKLADDSDGVTQEALADISKSSKELQNLDLTSRQGRASARYLTGVDRSDVLQALRNRPTESRTLTRDRVRSMIEPSQVQEALKLSRGGGEITPTVPRVAKRPTACSQYLLHGSATLHNGSIRTRQSNEFIPEIRVQASTPAGHGKPRTEHDLLDEGFEETQSLVSETPSQGTSSDVVDSPARRKPAHLTRADSSGSGETSSSTNTPTQAVSNSLSSAPIKLPDNTNINGMRQKLERSNSVKAAFGSRAETGRSGSSVLKRSSSGSRPQGNSQSVTPRQTNSHSNGELSNSRSSLRGSRSSLSTEGHCGPNSKRPGVERSNSRTSLRSSRSSLASATSVNTVRNITSPVSKSSSPSNVGRLTGYTSAIKSLTSNLRRSTPDCNSSVSKDLNKSGLLRSSTTPKRPLVPVQPKAPKTSIPASRSSSSGSSIGPTIQRSRATPGLSTSFKENSRANVPASRSSSSGSSVGASLKKIPSSSKVTLKPISSNEMRFMRPTAASVAKDIPGTVIKPRPGIRSAFK